MAKRQTSETMHKLFSDECLRMGVPPLSDGWQKPIKPRNWHKLNDVGPKPKPKTPTEMDNDVAEAKRSYKLGLMQAGGSEYEAGYLSGLAPDFGVTQAVADFYALEEMNRQGLAEAESMLERYEIGIAHQFATYIDMAIGGELRHMPSACTQNSDEHCAEWGGCCQIGVCSDAECGCGECTETFCACVEGQQDDDGNPIECMESHCDCAVCVDPSCGCDYDVDPDCQCGDCAYCGQANEDFSEYVSSFIYDFIEEADSKSGPGRSTAWRLWLKYRQRHGVNLVQEAFEAFTDAPWNDGYGGKAWGTCAKVLADYLNGRIKRRTFIDRCFTLQHNGGQVFNKVYCVDHMGAALETQAKGDYETLVTEWASDAVKSKWAYFKFLKSTRIGAKYIAETVAERMEAIAQGPGRPSAKERLALYGPIA